MSERENSSRQPFGALLEDLSKFCQSESLSEDGLREIIERHSWATNNNNDDPNITNYGFFHAACDNEKVSEGILRYLLEYFPNAAKNADGYVSIGEEKVGGCTPLHSICFNKNVTFSMVQLLIDAFPDSVLHEDDKGRIPLHLLCGNKSLDLEVKVDILMLLLERCPESVRNATRKGCLPIHIAAAYQSPEFCCILIETYPASERMTDNLGRLSFHAACQCNTVATAKYFLELYPESINVAADNGVYHPIYFAIEGVEFREYSSMETAIEMVKFLLGCNMDCDPNVALQKCDGELPLHWVCMEATNESQAGLNVYYLKILQILYDAHPEAIESNEVTSNVDSYCEEVQTFINTQIIYARQAREHHFMNAPDENGQLPLHKALRNNATITLGSIKLLVKGNPSAITCSDNNGMIPLHVACQHHDSASVVEYLLDLDPSSSRALDFDDNTVLHHACRGANQAIIALLLDKYGSMSISKRNTYGQLPIDLLLENIEFCDEESVEYTESIYRLLRANPETIINSII